MEYGGGLGALADSPNSIIYNHRLLGNLLDEALSLSSDCENTL